MDSVSSNRIQEQNDTVLNYEGTDILQPISYQKKYKV